MRHIITFGLLLASFWWPPMPLAADESSCAAFAPGSLSRTECEWLKAALLRQASPPQSPRSEPQKPVTPSPATTAEGMHFDFDREAARRICDAFGVTNEWTRCVDYYQQTPPCPRPVGTDARQWERCVWGAVQEVRKKVAEAQREQAERRRQAELEERRVRAMEESAKAQRDQARAQEGIAWGLNRPPACTTVLIAPGIVRTICD